MTISAPKGAALQKHYQPNPRTVDGSKGLDRVYPSGHSSDLLVEGTGDNLILLLLGQLDEINRIA